MFLICGAQRVAITISMTNFIIQYSYYSYKPSSLCSYFDRSRKVGLYHYKKKSFGAQRVSIIIPKQDLTVP